MHVYLRYSMFSFYVWDKNEYFPLHPRIQTGSGAYPASYQIGTVGSFLGGKAAVVRSWPLTSIHFWGQECMELCLLSPIRLQGVVLNLKNAQQQDPV
jgi:hypothetical protein